MRMRARFRVEWRVATTHPESIRTVHPLTTRYSKGFMFSVCVAAEQSVAPTNSSTVVHPTASSRLHRTRHAPPPKEDRFVICELYLHSQKTNLFK
jgi:hypothetical protein